MFSNDSIKYIYTYKLFTKYQAFFSDFIAGAMPDSFFKVLAENDS